MKEYQGERSTICQCFDCQVSFAFFTFKPHFFSFKAVGSAVKANNGMGAVILSGNILGVSVSFILLIFLILNIIFHFPLWMNVHRAWWALIFQFLFDFYHWCSESSLKPFLQIRCEFKSKMNAINLRMAQDLGIRVKQKGDFVKCSTAEPLNVSRFE